ncbi:MAG: glycosyltransferase family 39 protein [Anaerolineae bacterium]|nr:glycosyltransferase family 39 protein [Anaerolineae bacterium]MDW8069431.1 glycosyltransferase family 39 protein [Anaerolineae bacterium]
MYPDGPGQRVMSDNRLTPLRFCLLVSCLLFAFTLRAGGLDRWSLWYDEAYCWWVASRVPLREMLVLSAREVIPPLYYLLLRAWIPLAGATEFALRWPSVLLGVLTVACAGRLAWRLTGRWPGALGAGLLFAVGTPFLWASREVRMYGPALAWTLLADVALLEIFAAPTPRRCRLWVGLWAAATLAALYTLALAGFWLIGQGLVALLLLVRTDRNSRRMVLRQVLPPALIAAVLYLPWTWAGVRMAPLNLTYWHGYMPPLHFLRLSLGGLTVMGHLPAEVVETTALRMLLTTLMALTVSRPRLVAGLYPVLYITPLFLIAWVYQEIPKWGARHATLFAPGPFLALAIAWGSVWGIRRRGLRALAVLALAAATFLNGRPLWQANRNLLTNPAYAREDWRSAARYIQEHRSPGDVVILSTGSTFPTWLYYGGDEGMLPMPHDPLLDVTHVLTYTEVARTLNAALASCTPASCSVWLVAWLDGVTDPTRLVETLLEDVAREEPVPSFRGLKVRRFRLGRSPHFPLEPPTTDRPNAELLPGIHLWGYFLPEGPHPADRPLELRVWWTTDDPKRHEGQLYMASFRLKDAMGTEWGQDDRIVTDGDYRPERWVPGVPVFGRFFLHLPAGIPPGVYTPTLTLYTEKASGSVALQPIPVARPAAPPGMPGEFTPARSAGAPAPLALLGIHLFQGETSPCRRINGELFWEVLEPLREEYRVVVSAGEYREENPLAPAGSQALLRSGDRIRSYFQLPFPCRALDMEAPLEVRLVKADGTPTEGVWYGPTVVVRTERVFAEPTVPYEPIGAEFGPGFATLLGYRLDPPEVRAGQPFTITLIWQAGFTDDIPRSVFVHIAPPDAPAPLVAQHDGWPAQNMRPTHTWVYGEIITDPHPLPGLPAGQYQIRVGLYGPDGERMPIVMETARPPDRALSLPLAVP